MTPHPPQLDIVTVAIAAASAMLGTYWGGIVGPYAVIILAAMGGAAWSAASRPESTRWAAVRHGGLMVGLALLVTVPLAEFLTRWTGLESRWMLGPLAALIAARPEWVVAQIHKLYRSRAKPMGATDGDHT